MLKNLVSALAAIATAYALALWIEFLLIEKLSHQAVSTGQNTSMWYCDGWGDVVYPTEKSMKEAFR